MAEYMKSVPQIDSDSREYWEGCKRHELQVPRCKECRAFTWPPGPGCVKCGSSEIEWVKVSGKGKVYTWAVVNRSAHPSFKDDVPYAVVLIELDDTPGVRLISNMVDCKLEDIYIGMPVEVVFDDVTDEITLPKFGPAGK